MRVRFAMEEAVSEEVARQERGWKLLFLLLRMLLFRPPREGLISKGKLANRFSALSRGEWVILLESSARRDEQAAVPRRRRRQQGDDLQKRAVRAELKVALGELSSARQALEGEEVGPRTRETLRSLTDESERPPCLRDPIPLEISDNSQPIPFVLDPDKFLKNVRSAKKRGSKTCPSGVTVEHLRLILDSKRDQQLFCKLAETVAVGRDQTNCY